MGYSWWGESIHLYENERHPQSNNLPINGEPNDPFRRSAEGNSVQLNWTMAQIYFD
jgi:hypothetical protein